MLYPLFLKTLCWKGHKPRDNLYSLTSLFLNESHVPQLIYCVFKAELPLWLSVWFAHQPWINQIGLRNSWYQRVWRSESRIYSTLALVFAPDLKSWLGRHYTLCCLGGDLVGYLRSFRLIWGFRVHYEQDTKVANAGTFVLQREDHTIGNLSRTWGHFAPPNYNRQILMVAIVSRCHLS